MPGQTEKKPRWLRYSGLGIEFAGILAGFSFAGIWFGRHFGISPWGILAGFGLGLAVGLTRFIRVSLQALQDANKVGARPVGEPRDSKN